MSEGSAAIELERCRTNPEALSESLPESQVPDGGYGWVVVSGCAVLTWWFVGLSYSWGVMQAALVKQGLSSVSTLSFVGSLTTACISGLALVNVKVIRYLGAQRTGLLGVSLLGVIAGVGTSLCFMVVSVIPGQYFSRKRGLANGIVYAAGGLGGAVTSFTIDSLIRRLGTAWAFHVLGLITLATGIPAAWLIRERTSVRTPGFVDWSLFRDVRFITLFLAGAVGTFPLFVPPFFLPLYSTSLGLSPSAGAGLVAGFNFSSALGRLACGAASDRIGPVNVLFLALLLSALSMLAIWPVSTTLAPLAFFVVISGAANGGFFSTMPTVVGAVFGAARVGVAMGMIVTGWVGGYLMGAPIAGYLLSAYGGAQSSLSAYHPAMFYAGSMAMGAASFVSLLRLRTDTSILARV